MCLCFFIIRTLLLSLVRSLCEDLPHSEWKTIEEKEDKYQEMHVESLL